MTTNPNEIEVAKAMARDDRVRAAKLYTGPHDMNSAAMDILNGKLDGNRYPQAILLSRLCGVSQGLNLAADLLDKWSAAETVSGNSAMAHGYTTTASELRILADGEFGND